MKTADIQTKTSAIMSYETRLWAEEKQNSGSGGGPISRLVNHITIAVAVNRVNPAVLCFIFRPTPIMDGEGNNNFSIFWGSGREAHLNKLVINLP